jgi:hypothetical protein
MTEIIMWHSDADICVSSVHSNKPPKTVHNQVAVPLTTYGHSKQRNLNGNTHSALQCVCQQHSLQFLSPYCITVCVPATLSAVPVTILHYSVCASKDLCSSCHHTALQCVCQQHSLQFLSPYCLTDLMKALVFDFEGNHDTPRSTSLGRHQLRVPSAAYVVHVFDRPNSCDICVLLCLNPMACHQALLVPQHQLCLLKYLLTYLLTPCSRVLLEN